MSLHIIIFLYCVDLQFIYKTIIGKFINIGQVLLFCHIGNSALKLYFLILFIPTILYLDLKKVIKCAYLHILQLYWAIMKKVNMSWFSLLKETSIMAMSLCNVVAIQNKVNMRSQ